MEKSNNSSEFNLILKYALKDLSRNYHKISSIIITLFIRLNQKRLMLNQKKLILNQQKLLQNQKNLILNQKKLSQNQKKLMLNQKKLLQNLRNLILNQKQLLRRLKQTTIVSKHLAGQGGASLGWSPDGVYTSSASKKILFVPCQLKYLCHQNVTL